jgi:hypothetical protein
MLISNKHKFIFLKNRKISGSTFESLIFPHLGPDDVCTGSPTDGTPKLNIELGLGHMGWNQISLLYSNEWNNYYRFAIERNPWDKCVSAFKWHSVIKPHLPGVRENNFNMYLEKQINMLPTDWKCYTNQGKIMVDRVFTFEKISELYNAMRNKFSIDIPEELYYNTRLKRTDRKHYSEYYDDESKEFVAELFKNEIETFGYEYEQR